MRVIILPKDYIKNKADFDINYRLKQTVRIGVIATIFVTILQYIASADQHLQSGIIIGLLKNTIFSFSITVSAVIVIPYIFHNFQQKIDIRLKAVLLFVLDIIAMATAIFFAQILIYVLGFADTVFFLGEIGFYIVLIFSGFVALVSTIYYNLKEKLELAFDDIRKKDQQKADLEILKTKADLESLQSKINPHFLFNSLNSIAGLISINPEKAETMTLKLSELFRSVLKFQPDIFSNLKDEIHLIETYLEIEKIRFGKRLKFKINIDTKLHNMKIPQLLIQPIVENSLKHGIEPIPEGGTVSIQITKKDGKISIVIEDNGVGFSSGISFGYGLTNVERRLKNLFGDTYEFFFESDKTTRVTILIPNHSKFEA